MYSAVLIHAFLIFCCACKRRSAIHGRDLNLKRNLLFIYVWHVCFSWITVLFWSWLIGQEPAMGLEEDAFFGKFFSWFQLCNVHACFIFFLEDAHEAGATGWQEEAISMPCFWTEHVRLWAETVQVQDSSALQVDDKPWEASYRFKRKVLANSCLIVWSLISFSCCHRITASTIAAVMMRLDVYANTWSVKMFFSVRACC